MKMSEPVTVVTPVKVMPEVLSKSLDGVKGEKTPEDLLLELQKKFRAVMRKSASGAPVHVHDLKLCLDLFLLETRNHPEHGLQTHHVESALDQQNVIGGKKLQLSPNCIAELKSWKSVFSKKHRKSHHLKTHVVRSLQFRSINDGERKSCDAP